MEKVLYFSDTLNSSLDSVTAMASRREAAGLSAHHHGPRNGELIYPGRRYPWPEAVSPKAGEPVRPDVHLCASTGCRTHALGEEISVNQ